MLNVFKKIFSVEAKDAIDNLITFYAELRPENFTAANLESLREKLSDAITEAAKIKSQIDSEKRELEAISEKIEIEKKVATKLIEKGKELEASQVLDNLELLDSQRSIMEETVKMKTETYQLKYENIMRIKENISNYELKSRHAMTERENLLAIEEMLRQKNDAAKEKMIAQEQQVSTQDHGTEFLSKQNQKLRQKVNVLQEENKILQDVSTNDSTDEITKAREEITNSSAKKGLAERLKDIK